MCVVRSRIRWMYAHSESHTNDSRIEHIYTLELGTRYNMFVQSIIAKAKLLVLHFYFTLTLAFIVTTTTDIRLNIDYLCV
jgi:hypothetical protein